MKKFYLFLIIFFLFYCNKITKKEVKVTKIKKDGIIDTKDGSWVFLFKTLPGSNGKPKKKVKTVRGKIPFYDYYDWAEHHKELKGQKGHLWVKVHPKKGWWVYKLRKFKIKWKGI